MQTPWEFFSLHGRFTLSLRVSLWLLLSYSVSFFLAPPLALSFSLCLSLLSLSFFLSLSLSLSLFLCLSPSHFLFSSSKKKKKTHFLPFKRRSLSSPLVCSIIIRLKEKRNWKLPESNVSCCFRIQCLAQFFCFFSLSIFPKKKNTRQKLHVPGYMVKYIPQLEKIVHFFLFHYCWSCMIIYKQQNQNAKNVTFSPMQTRSSSPIKTMQEFKFIAFVLENFFTE